MANPFVHIELNTSDLGKAKAFYGALFGWTLTDAPGGPTGIYTSIQVGDGTGGGMLQHPMGGPSIWIPYILVDDAAAATAKAKQLGAAVIKENQSVPDRGAFSILSDPTGAAFALWQDKS